MLYVGNVFLILSSIAIVLLLLVMFCRSKHREVFRKFPGLFLVCFLVSSLGQTVTLSVSGARSSDAYQELCPRPDCANSTLSLPTLNNEWCTYQAQFFQVIVGVEEI
jgi:hypothetical protein